MDAVRLKAVSAFQHLSELTTSEQAHLSKHFSNEPEYRPIVACSALLQDSPVQLPDLILNLAKICVAGDNDDTEHGHCHSASMELSKIIVRLLVQTEDSKVRAQCLDLIDAMEEHYFIGLSAELNRVDR